MMWLVITITAYFLLAVVNLIDKILMEKILPSAGFYASMISLGGGVVVVAAPWFVVWPGWSAWGLDMIAGALFTVALWIMFKALQHGDVSKITVMIGGLIPVITMIWSVLVDKQVYDWKEYMAVGLLLLGTLVIASIRGVKKSITNWIWALILSVLAALMYATHFILIKIAYDHQVFESAFIWRGLGSASAGLMLLFSAEVRAGYQTFFKPKKKKKNNNLKLVIAGQVSGAVGFIMQSYAISLKPVAIINSLQGVQYAFLLIMGWLVTIFYPKWLKEDLRVSTVVQKIIGIVLVALGIVLLSL